MRIQQVILIIVLLLNASFSICFSKDNSVYNIKFLSGKNKLPAKIILLDNHLKTQNRIFFLNRKYGEAYCQIVEYDLKEEKVIKTLYDSENNLPIREYSFDNRNIAWSVINIEGENYSADIYVYDNHSKNTWMMKKDIPCGEENFGLVPISLKVNNGRIVWIEHSINEKKSCIKQFHLQNNQELIVQTFDFLPEAEHIKFSSFFLELKGNMLFFDKRESENRIFIVRWDVGSNQQVDQWKVKEDIVLHYKNIQQQCNIYCSTEYFRGNC